MQYEKTVGLLGRQKLRRVVGGVEGGNLRREIWLGQSIIVGGKNRSGVGREEATFWRRGVEGERGGGVGATEA